MAVLQIELPHDEVVAFCHKWRIAELAVFGSVLRPDFGPESDVDVLIAFSADANWGLFDHVRMEQELSQMLQRPVDLVSRRAIESSHNWIRRNEILRTAEVIYAA